MRKNLIIAIIILLVIVVSYFVFFYRSDFQVCLFGLMCTGDINYMCNPVTEESRTVPSSCSCGIDKGVLEKRGWVSCPGQLRE